MARYKSDGVVSTTTILFTARPCTSSPSSFYQLRDTLLQDNTICIFDMAPKLEQVFTMRCFLNKNDTLAIGPIHGGSQRMIAPVISGFIEGSGIKMEFTSGGSDWPRLDTTTGTLHLDTRSQARNNETGDCVYL